MVFFYSIDFLSVLPYPFVLSFNHFIAGDHKVQPSSIWIIVFHAYIALVTRINPPKEFAITFFFVVIQHVDNDCYIIGEGRGVDKEKTSRLDMLA